MELESSANPHIGSGVRDAAAAIESLGLLDSPQGTTEEQATDESQSQPDTGGTDESPQVEPVSEESEGETPPEKSAETEAESEAEQELPDTLDGLAEAVGLSADEFAAHVKVPVTVAGKTEMVTLAEARKGYQLDADYRSKTTELADQRRSFETQTQEATTEWQTRFQSQAALTEQLERAVGESTADLDRILIDEGAEAYISAKAKVEANQKLLDHAKGEKAKAEANQSEQQQQAQANYALEQKNLLVQHLPDFADDVKGPKLADRIRSNLITAGFNEREVGGVVDHRMLIVAHKAMLYDELQKAKPGTAKKLKGLPRVQKPGAKPERGDAARQKATAKVQRLQRSGSRHDFAASILDDL